MISIDSEEAAEKIQYPFLIESLLTGTKGNFLNTILTYFLLKSIQLLLIRKQQVFALILPD